jgi:hypothetical protein
MFVNGLNGLNGLNGFAHAEDLVASVPNNSSNTRVTPPVVIWGVLGIAPPPFVWLYAA